MYQNNINSIHNYYNSVEPHLTHARQIVYNAIREMGRPVMDTEIATHLNIPINRVSGRVGDLEKLGLIICNDAERNESGNKCRKSRINEEHKVIKTRYFVGEREVINGKLF